MNAIPAEYDTFRPRCLALGIDVLILAPLVFLFLWVMRHSTDRAVLAFCYIFISFLGVTYRVLLHGFFGQTLGKRFCGVTVLDQSGDRLSMRQAILRASPGIVFSAVGVTYFIYLILQGIDVLDSDQRTIVQSTLKYMANAWILAEIATMFMNPKRRTIHDYIAQTVVVRTKWLESSELSS